IAEATQVSLIMHKTAIAAEAKENIAKVQEKLDEEEIKKMVDRSDDDETDSDDFATNMMNEDGYDFDDKIVLGNHKENPEVIVDDDVNVVEKEKDVDDDV
ncbi:hypothetical protein Tco_0555196, partial [Tanacetum coccineum]